MKKLTITPFLIVIGALAMLLLLMSIYFLFLDNNGGRALGGVITLIGFITFIIILAIEQSVLNFKKFNSKNVWLIESVILIIVVIYIYLNGISIG